MIKKAVWLGLLCVLTGPRPAAADARIVSEVTVEAAGSVTRRSVTACFRDDKVRVESGGDVVLLYDLGGRKVYRLDVARKTYRIADLGENAPSGAADRLRSGRRTVRVHVQASEETRTVAGLSARKRVVAAHAETEGDALRRENPWGAASARVGGGMYGLGIPTGAKPREEDAPSPPKAHEPAAIDVNAEYWLTDAVPLGRSPIAALPYVALTLPTGGLPLTLLEPLWAKLGVSSKEFPLSSRVVTTPAPADGNATVVTTEVRSIATTPLDRMLFYVPSDYTQDEGR